MTRSEQLLFAALLFATLAGFGFEHQAQTTALREIAANTKALADKQQQPPPINGECHEALTLFDERIRHDLRMGLPDKKPK